MRVAIVLAAGRSRRFGRRDKLAEPVGGRALVDHALVRAAASDARAIILVVRRGFRLRCDVSVKPVRIVRVASGGLSRSLNAGLGALRPIDREVWVFLGDMPFAEAPSRVRLRGGDVAVRPIHAGTPGHPMLVRAALARRALPAGDRGLGRLSARPVRGKAGNILDIDDIDALRRLRRAWR